MSISSPFLKSSNSFLCVFHPPVTSIFTSVTCCRRQLAFRLLTSCRIFHCSLTLSNTSFPTYRLYTWLDHPGSRYDRGHLRSVEGRRTRRCVDVSPYLILPFLFPATGIQPHVSPSAQVSVAGGRSAIIASI